MSIVVIHGPQATGKTFHRETFKKHFRCSRIVDGWSFGQTNPRSGDLVLTCEHPEDIRRLLPRAAIFSIKRAREVAGLGPVPSID